MSEGIGSIGPIVPARAVDAAVMTLTGAPASQRGTARRERRMQWLSSVRQALGDAAPLVDEMAAIEGAPEQIGEAQARIAEALGTVDEMRDLLDHPADPGSSDQPESHAGENAGPTNTAMALARRIAASAEQSLRVQAQLGAAAVRHLVGEQK